MGAVEVSSGDALRVRMHSLLLRGAPAGRTAGEVVEWFGAMQAQDHGSGLWSLGRRVPGSTRPDIEAAVERGEVLRTWPMRGTIHLVPPRDARWMLELTGVRALAGAAARREHLGLSDADADRATQVLGDALAGGRRMTRAECVDTLAAAGIDAAGQRAYHLLWYASQQGVTCIGPHRGSEQTFVRLDEWSPDQHRPGRDEALAILATRFVRSHGPVTRQDFAGWTGLPAGEAKAALALAGDAVTVVRVDGKECYAHPPVLDAALATPAATAHIDDHVDALSGFDEYLLGYKDRSLMADKATLAAVVPGGNGVFRWTLVRDGRVVATWQRKQTSKALRMTVHPLADLTGPQRAAAQAALDDFARFTGLPGEVSWESRPAA